MCYLSFQEFFSGSVSIYEEDLWIEHVYEIVFSQMCGELILFHGQMKIYSHTLYKVKITLVQSHVIYDQN